mmetsp:Transcript_9138/g.9041  ORF Transcript_9138/g.9041 Transcript_9138/m.9041 type:complete len:265 (+) Transcript_9138:201-995(+)
MFTLNNSSQLAAICNDSINTNSTSKYELFDSHEETNNTSVFSDSPIAKGDEFKRITNVAADILLQLNQETSNTLELIKQEEEDSRLTKNTNGRYICAKCDTEIEKLSYLAIHNRSHSGKIHFTCPQCQCIFHTLNDLSNHCQKHSMTQISCPKCKECFEDSRLFKMHLEVHIIEMESNDDEMQDDDDDEEIPDIDKDLLYDEIYCLHEIVLVQSLGISGLLYKELFPCKYCLMVCTSKVRLSIHLLVHKEYAALTTNKYEVSPI